MIPTGVVVVTDRRQARAPLPEVVAAAVSGGVRWVLMREKDLPPPEREALAHELREVMAQGTGGASGWGLIVAGPDPLGGEAVHLASADPVAGAVPSSMVGRSCHDAAELAELTTEDYVTLSPVFPSASKPGYGPPLGLERFGELCRQAGRPVLALGGIETPSRAEACVTAGAVGVAVSGAVMRAPDPAVMVARLRSGMVAGMRAAIGGKVVGR